MSAPASINAFAAPALFSAAAHIRAVCPFQPSFAFTLAPWASSALTAGTLPVRAAVISAVSPSGNAVFASAPAASSFSITAASPLTHARYNGVTPYRVAALASAPARSRASTRSVSLLRTARCSGVVPSGSDFRLGAGGWGLEAGLGAAGWKREHAGSPRRNHQGHQEHKGRKTPSDTGGAADRISASFASSAVTDVISQLTDRPFRCCRRASPRECPTCPTSSTGGSSSACRAARRCGGRL